MANRDGLGFSLTSIISSLEGWDLISRGSLYIPRSTKIKTHKHWESYTDVFDLVCNITKKPRAVDAVNISCHSCFRFPFFQVNPPAKNSTAETTASGISTHHRTRFLNPRKEEGRRGWNVLWMFSPKLNEIDVPSLKLRYPLKIDGWKLEDDSSPFGMAYSQGRNC